MAKRNGNAVIVATLTDDKRTKSIPRGITVCALRFTDKAHAKVISAGGQCLTFDQLAVLAPKGFGCNLLRGHNTTQSKTKYASLTSSHKITKLHPQIGSYGRKREQARGRRNSKGFKT